MLKLHKEGGAMSEIKERLAHVMERIETAREKSPYHQQVTLVAVTKFHPIKAVSYTHLTLPTTPYV